MTTADSVPDDYPAEVSYPRNLLGYGTHLPNVAWPRNARLALNFVLNYEEGAEYSPLNGDAHAETFINELPGGGRATLGRNVISESGYDYGARVGVWRLLRIFEKAGVPLTIFAVGQALELNPHVGRAFSSLGHEVASHHWRWIDYSDMDPKIEREHLLRSIDAIERHCGRVPVGWYGGRVSLNSRRIAAETGVFLYDSDVYDDDLPHWTQAAGQNLLLLSYSLDTNDVKFSVAPGFNTGADFEIYLRDTFDTLYAEGSVGSMTPRLMSVGLHCRVSGRPGRAAAIARFLDYVAGFEDVWVCRREQIARHWIEQHEPEPGHTQITPLLV